MVHSEMRIVDYIYVVVSFVDYGVLCCATNEADLLA